jgi:hypothetical protein
MCPVPLLISTGPFRSIHPDFAKAYRLRGRIKQRLGDQRGADDDFQKAKVLEGASTDRPS